MADQKLLTSRKSHIDNEKVSAFFAMGWRLMIDAVEKKVTND